jgi:CheY-like chemotaxis protein
MDEIAVVITDMMMPVMDGPATIQALRRINPAIKIIAASGLNPDSRSAKATSAMVKHFLMKPYTAGGLLRDRGANPFATDTQFHGTPADWARHAWHTDLSEWLRAKEKS